MHLLAAVPKDVDCIAVLPPEELRVGSQPGEGEVRHDDTPFSPAQEVFRPHIAANNRIAAITKATEQKLYCRSFIAGHE